MKEQRTRIRRTINPDLEWTELRLNLNSRQIAAVNALLKAGLYGNTPASVCMCLVNQRLMELKPL